MKRIRYLTVRFDAQLDPEELPAFRGAIAAVVGPGHPLFHNHDENRPGKVIYRYPAIQYKRIGGNAALICVESGVDAIHALFQQPSWAVVLNNRPLTLTVADLRLKQYTLQAWAHTFRFQLRNWLALNEVNYARYQNTPDELDRIELLERILRGNILSMAKGLDWHIDREVRVRLHGLPTLRWLSFKGQRMAGFDANFSTNVFLPDFIGLGKGVSIGFGVVNQTRTQGASADRANKLAEEIDNQPHETTHDDEY